MTALRPSGFGAYLSSAATSYLGDGLRMTALPLLAATLTPSPEPIALVAAASTLPWLLLGLPAGLFVDRIDRIRTMRILQLVRGGVVALAVIGVLTGRMNIAGLVVVAVVLGSCEVVYDLASHAVLPQIVTQDRLEWANGRLVAAEVTTAEFAGPALGGMLFAVAVSLPLQIDAATFFISAVLLSVPARSGSRPAPAADSAARFGATGHMIGDLRAGLSWFWSSHLVRSLTALSAVINLGLGGFNAVLVVFARRELSLGPVGFGLLIAVGSCGSVVASLVVARLLTRQARRIVLTATGPVIALCLIVAVATRSVLVVGIAMVVFGFVTAVFNIVAMSVRQSVVPVDMLGRVLSVHRLLCWGALPLGALTAGVIAARFGSPAAITCCAGLIIVFLVPALPPILRATADRPSDRELSTTGN